MKPLCVVLGFTMLGLGVIIYFAGIPNVTRDTTMTVFYAYLLTGAICFALAEK